LTGTADVPADAFFMPLTTTWGWATWSRAWRLFDWSTDGMLDVLAGDAAFRARFNLDGAANFQSMLSDRISGKNDSWGILWWYAVARANVQVLYPRTSLVWNGGFDNSGVHCAGDLAFQPEAPAQFQKSNLPAALRMPDKVEPNMAVFADVRNFIRGSAAGSPSVTEGAVAKSIRKLRKRWYGR
jgi:hypothetical protein